MNPEVVAGITRIARGFAARDTRLRADVDDLIQEALVEVWQSGHPAWAYQARLAMIDWLRTTYGRSKPVRDEHGNIVGRRKQEPLRGVRRWDSLDAPIAPESTTTVGDMVPDTGDFVESVVERVDGMRVLARMSDRDRGIVWARGVGVPLRQAGEAHGVTESRACQVVGGFRAA